MSIVPVWLISGYLQRLTLRCSTSHRSPRRMLVEPFGGLLQRSLKGNNLSTLQVVIFTLLLVFRMRYFAFRLVRYQLLIPSTQIFSGLIPFHEIHDHAVILQVIRGQRPSRPSICEPWNIACDDLGLDDDTWAAIDKCWNQEPEKRPAAKEVGAFLRAKLGLSRSNDESQNTVATTSPWGFLEFIQ